MAIDRKRLEFATEGFMAQMRKEHEKANPGEASPVRPLKDYPPEFRAALVNCVDAALKLTEARNDTAYLQWLDRQGQ